MERRKVDMKENEIIENRPELSREQILEGMDFSRIKRNAASTSGTGFQSLVIKSILGFSIVTLGIFIYILNKESISNPDKPKVILEDKSPLTATAETKSNSISSSQGKYNLTRIDQNIQGQKKETFVSKDHKEITDSLRVTEPERGSASIQDVTSSQDQNGSLAKTPERSTTTEQLKLKSSEAIKITNEKLDTKEINRSLVRVSEKIYASKYEVSNGLYMAFLNSLKGSLKDEQILIARIDTSRWKDSLTYNPAYSFYYHIHPAYRDFPVVNVSYEGAKLFCEWLTDNYNSDPKRKFKRVLFRLPSANEWMLAAQAGNANATYPWEGKDLKNTKGEMMANFKRMEGADETSGAYKDADVTAPVNSYTKNKFGFFNLAGNVAEMVKVKGLAKGGGWRDGPELLKINSKFIYDGKADPSIGFRYFAEILEE